MATTTTSAKNSFFVQVPLAVIERRGMHAAYKIGFEQLIHVCWKQHSDTLQGSQRKLAAMCSVSKSSFLAMAKAWVNAGWIALQVCGRELLITLLRDGMLRPQSVQKSDTFEQDQQTEASPSSVSSVQKSDTHDLNQDADVPISDTAVRPTDTNDQKSDGLCPSAELKVGHKRREENLLESPIQSLKREILSSSLFLHETKEGQIPELTPELALDLVSRVIPVPPRPTNPVDLKEWLADFYEPTKGLITDVAPVNGPQAWELMDEATRFMVFGPSWWATKRKKATPINMRHVRENYHIQHQQIAKLGWKPEERTPYPDAPSQQSAEENVLVDQQELDALVAALLAPDPIQTVPLRDTPRVAQPFATEQELRDYAGLLLQCVPELQLVIANPPDGGFVLLAQCGLGDCYIGLDPEIWEYPTPGEMELIQAAVDYGQMSQIEQPEMATI